MDILNQLAQLDPQQHLTRIKTAADYSDSLTLKQRNERRHIDIMLNVVGPIGESWVMRYLSRSGVQAQKGAQKKTDILWKDKTVEVKIRGGMPPDASDTKVNPVIGMKGGKTFTVKRGSTPNIFFERYSNGNTSATWRDEPDYYVVVTEDGRMWWVSYPQVKRALQSSEIGKPHTPQHANTEGYIVHWKHLLDRGWLRIINPMD